MNTDIPLPIMVHPWPISPERAQLIITALQRINSPIKVIPVEGGPMGADRVLCFGSLPPYLCRSIPISPANVDNIDSIEAALRYFLDPWRDEDRWGEDFTLGMWMGADVKFSHSETEGMVEFR